MRILVVEDDDLIAKPLVQALSEQHYAVDIASDGEAGWEFVEAFAYDLIVLDVGLPKLDGISLCRRIRSRGIHSPIILLTAQDSSTHKVAGLDAGADDYITKPFDLQELLARIRASMRRGGLALPPELQWENLKLDPSICEVKYNNKTLHLTPKEYSLLELFLRNPHRIFNCGAIIDHLWSFEEPPGEDTVRTHLKGLRMKLKKAGLATDPIETVYGIGYRLKALEEIKKQGDRGSKKKGRGGDQKKGGQESENLLPTSPNPPISLSPQPPSPTPQDLKYQTQRIIANAWEKAKEKIGDRITVIEQATTALFENVLNEELRLQARSEAHKLAGSLGMFGFEFGSRVARQIEELLEVEVRLIGEQKLQLSELVVSLRRELQLTNAKEQVEESSVDGRPLVLLVGLEKPLDDELVRSADTWNVQTFIVSKPGLVKKHFTSRRPDAVVLNLQGTMTDEGLELLAELNCSAPPVPVLVLTDRDSLLDRVKIARLGGQGFLQKPVASAMVLETIANLIQRNRQATAKVLFVDDDPLILNAMCSLLQPWGLKVSTLENPLEFWDTLEATAPDLLVLDVEMPQMSGIELCQVVRNDPHYCGLPVLFLTSHTDAETMRRVFAVGADDYVCKPIVGPELVTRILNRLERSRLLKNMAETDALTGVANRRQSTYELNELMNLSSRHHQPFCFAVLKVDRLAQINQQYGHAIGDEVLSRLGRILRRVFQSDVVCRWGGAEFVVGMYGMTQKDGWQRLEEVAENITQENFIAPDGSRFQVTFSAGVAQYPKQGADLQVLYQAALARCDRPFASQRAFTRVREAELRGDAEGVRA
ncbi:MULTISPECIES: response regulator [Nostocales]|uniref:Response regulator n=3 Tax=Nostocales TaxID=1161 RepID=A0A0C1R960_9CYAN|nr:response regulator [Tolypothrix bouteillei]KAF3890445.1 response regulator [Tolypothrix bouteillei VB521301]